MTATAAQPFPSVTAFRVYLGEAARCSDLQAKHASRRPE
jgi:hypothetical protein